MADPLTDRDAMLAAVIAAPDDDLPRLVYADWLDDHSFAERAEFIRVQVALAYPTLGPDGTGDSGLRYRQVRREQELFDAHAYEWFPVPAGNVLGWGLFLPGDSNEWPDRPGSCVVRRGFVAEVRGPLAAFWGERACEWCESGLEETPGGFFRHCRECHGTGRVSGPTPAFRELVRREPVTTVGVTDCEPWENDVADPPLYRWQAADGEPEADFGDLPPALFAALVPHPDHEQTDRRTSRAARLRLWHYPTEADARAALSAALIAEARR